MISLFQAVILSIIQGITEWFPISSSGHLALFQQIFGFQDLPFDVFLHFASIFAIIFVFRKEIRSILRIDTKDKVRYILYLLIAMIPAGIAGIFLRDYIEIFFSSGLYLGIFFIFSGIVIYLTKFSVERKRKVSLFDSIFIGIFQAVALLPGVSRSGFTISSGLFKGLDKKAAIKFSFFLAILAILGASVLELGDLAFSEISYSILIVSFIITLFVSIFTIKLLIRIINSEKFYLFGLYNIVLGLLILILYIF